MQGYGSIVIAKSWTRKCKHLALVGDTYATVCTAIGPLPKMLHDVHVL